MYFFSICFILKYWSILKTFTNQPENVCKETIRSMVSLSWSSCFFGKSDRVCTKSGRLCMMVGRVVKYENILFLLFKYLKRFFWKYFQECNQTSKKKTFSSKIFLVENNLHYKILFYNEKKKMEPKDPFASIKKCFCILCCLVQPKMNVN